MIAMYDWTIKRSGIGLVIIGTAVINGNKKAEHKLQAKYVEIVEGTIYACDYNNVTVAILRWERTGE